MTLTKPSSSVLWWGWHAAGIAALILVPMRLQLEMGGGGRAISTGLIACYALTAILLTFYFRHRQNLTLSPVASICGIVFGSFFLVLLLARVDYTRAALGISLVVIAGFLGLSLALNRFRFAQKGALCVVAIPLLVAAMKGAPDATTSSPTGVEIRLIRSSLYRVVARFYKSFAEEQGTGGALAQYGDRYLLATGDGDLFVFSWSPETKRLERTKLSLRVPMNRGEFERDAAGKKVYTRTFRTADILVQDFGDDFRLFASHHHWNADQQCFTVRVSAVAGNYRDFEHATDASVTWETVYDSQPCLHFKDRGDPFGGEQVGGKMALLDSHRLLLTVGDQMYDGVEAKEMLPQDPAAHYGKTILIDLDSKSSSVYTLGHRNPQGLTVDTAGNIWETEHGPQGGDELNHIDQGKNYGWPLVTYGRNYGRLTWPLNPKPGRHENYELPSHAWVPSIGVSALTTVKDDLFGYWKDDLLAASLGDQSLWRIRTDHNRTILTERLKVGKRIRDVMEDRNGRLVLWTEENQLAPTQTAIVIIEPVTQANPNAMVGLTRAERGELEFDSCTGCHRIEDGRSHGIGPDLKGVFGRQSASAADYSYSDALKAFSRKWTAKTLNEFLENPERVVPGTSMQFEGLADAEERASIIEYLQTSH